MPFGAPLYGKTVKFEKNKTRTCIVHKTKTRHPCTI